MGPDNGWISGTMGHDNMTMGSGTFSTPHNVFPRREKTTDLDGGKFDVHSLTRQVAKSECHVCGYPLINEAWPTGEWRHMTTEEVGRYAPNYQQSSEHAARTS